MKPVNTSSCANGEMVHADRCQPSKAPGPYKRVNHAMLSAVAATANTRDACPDIRPSVAIPLRRGLAATHAIAKTSKMPSCHHGEI